MCGGFKGDTMNLLVLDFETYFDGDYTLKKLTTEAYIRDPRFEALCCGFWDPSHAMRDHTLFWEDAEHTTAVLREIDWSKTAVVCHHAQFDGLILSHHYGIKPAFWFDTLSMARLVIGNHLPVGLGPLALHFGLSPKNVPYDLFRGRHWHELSDAEQQELGDACAHDVALTYQLFQRLLPRVPREELELIDLTIRMFTEPTLEGDIEELDAIARDEAAAKQKAMDDLGIKTKELASADQFAAILTGLGVEVEYKTTPKGNSIPAVAKTDDFMKELCDHENKIISALAHARLATRSTIDETRAARLAGAARRGKLPVYLGYCAAHTTRWGGGDKVNFQNFRRGGRIRKALKAPEGHLLLIADASQIECRFLEWFADEQQALEDFRKGGDPYCGIASQFYGRTITKADEAERGMGKQIRLSCGYGAGGASIVQTAKRGTYGPPVLLTDAEGLAARDLYRRNRPGVVRCWKEGDEVLAFMGGNVRAEMDWGVLVVVANGDGSGYIEGPTGTRMLYTLERDDEGNGWKRRTRRGWSRIWGGHLVENVIQFLARVYIGGVLVRVKDTFPALKLATTSHDEGTWVLLDDGDAPHYLEHVLGFMREPPAWAPDIPLDAEGHLSKVYDK